MNDIETTDVWKDGFSTSKEAFSLTNEIKKNLGLQYHYQIARLAIGRSLGEPTFPETATDAKGTGIPGHTLFGDEQQGGLLWLALLVENIYLHLQTKKKFITLQMLKQAVRDHWHRGIFLLEQDWEEAGDYSKFIELLITRRATLPNEGNYSANNNGNQQNNLIAKGVALNLGTDKDSGELIQWIINGQGYSPNVAIMGQAGAGKTRMMLKLLTELRTLTNVPVLLIDAEKDILAKDSDLAMALGARVLKIPSEAIPLDIFAGSTLNSNSARDVTIAFRESLDKALEKGLTDNQKMRVLEALKPLFVKQENITMQGIKKAIEQYYENNSIKPDRVVTIPNELCQYKLFEPTLSPSEFFNQSWILTFGNAPYESRRLTLFLLLDALDRYLRTLSESPLDENNHRAIRMALAIDEARPLLDAKHNGLSNMVRLHRSQGLTVFMASQSPDDYAGQSDDYMEQIGLPICFKTNASSTSVLNNMFKSKLNFSALEPGTCLTVIKNKTCKVEAFK